jgi:transposase-like protein
MNSSSPSKVSASIFGVDQDGEVIDILVTMRRDRRAAKRFFRKALK